MPGDKLRIIFILEKLGPTENNLKKQKGIKEKQEKLNRGFKKYIFSVSVYL